MTVTREQVLAQLYPDEPDYEGAAQLGPEALPHLMQLIEEGDPDLPICNKRPEYFLCVRHRLKLLGYDGFIAQLGRREHTPCRPKRRTRPWCAASWRRSPRETWRRLTNCSRLTSSITACFPAKIPVARASCRE